MLMDLSESRVTCFVCVFLFQSGFMFNQASPGSERTPFNHASLLPNVTESFREAWFPVLNTKGISTANKTGTLYVAEQNGFLVFNFSITPFKKLEMRSDLYKF